MTDPLVSVVIAAYNAAPFLPETLESALAQSYAPREIILVDDGSTDETPARVAPYLSRIHYHRNAHAGLAAARNTGVALATGDYVALLDADDLWLPEKLAVQVAVAQRHPESGLVICDGVGFDGTRQTMPHLLGRPALNALEKSRTGEVTGDYHRALISGDEWAGIPAQVLLPRPVLDRMGPFVDILNQDTEYWLRVSQHYPLTFHRHSLVRYRIHGAGMSGPLKGRVARYRRGHMVMLRIHAARCRGPERRIIRQRLAGLVSEAAYAAYQAGRVGDRGQASRELLDLLRERPWPPTALPYLAGVWAPERVRRIGAGVSRLVKRVGIR